MKDDKEDKMFVPADDLEIMPANRIGNDYGDYYICASSSLVSNCVNASVKLFHPGKNMIGSDGDDIVWQPFYRPAKDFVECSKEDIYADPFDGSLENDITDWYYDRIESYSERSDRYFSYLESSGIVKLVKRGLLYDYDQEAPFMNAVMAWIDTNSEGEANISVRIGTQTEARSGEPEFIYQDEMFDTCNKIFYGYESEDHIGRSIYEQGAVEDVTAWIMDKISEFTF